MTIYKFTPPHCFQTKSSSFFYTFFNPLENAYEYYNKRDLHHQMQVLQFVTYLFPRLSKP